MMDHQNGFPYDFDNRICRTCGGKCCRGFGGYVWISMEEIEIIADERKMEVALFLKQYVRQVQGRLSLTEYVINGEHLCCFFDRIEGQCKIYQSRPFQCSTFPFWNLFKKNFQKLFLECPGVILK